jgi:hypothetical protein
MAQKLPEFGLWGGQMVEAQEITMKSLRRLSGIRMFMTVCANSVIGATGAERLHKTPQKIVEL